jgi:hypothetical protein
MPQISAFCPNSFLRASGAIYSKVPMKVDMNGLLSIIFEKP